LNARASIAEFLPGLKIAITEIPGHLDEQQLQQQGLLGKIGSKYTGSLHETSDRSWAASAREHVLLVEKKLKLRPERVIFQSWKEK
jgi:hypothetical protein